MLGSVDIAALNEDGTINSQDNPAKTGSVVSIFGTGQGLADRPQVDGALADAPFATPLLPVRVTTFGGDELPVLYAGAAPGLINGVLQVNFRLPVQATPGTSSTVWYLHLGEAQPIYGRVYTGP